MNRIFVFLLLIATAIGCQNDQNVEHGLIYHIPDQAKIIVALSDLQEFDDLLKENPIYEQLSGLSRIQSIEKSAGFLRDYQLKGSSFVVLSMEGKNKPVITLATEDYKSMADSTSLIKKITYNDIEITERQSANGLNYFEANKDGAHLASSSILVLESLIRRNLNDYVFDDAFARLYERTHQNLSIYTNAQDEQWLLQFLFGRNKTSQNNFADWYQVEPQMDGSSLNFEGLIIYKDSVKQKQVLYDQLTPRENQVGRIAPAGFLKLSSTSYTSKEQLLKNLTSYHNIKPELPKLLDEILANSQEIATINLEEGAAIAFTLLPYENLFIDLDSISSAKETYRDFPVYSLQDSLMTTSIQPLVPRTSLKKVAVLDDILVASSSGAVLEQIIANYENGTTLSAQSWWKSASEKMSSSSSLIRITSIDYYQKNILPTNDKDVKILKSMDQENLSYLISQYVHEEGYAFYRMQIPYSSSAGDQPLVAQYGVYKSELPIIAGPFLFPNHLNNTYDVVFQTEDLKLHLVSESGTPYWEKELEAPILGDVQVVDVYKNGRKQLIFNTSQKVHLLDREGKAVDQFPFAPKKQISQPLSVFDYDNNRNYRFVVTTGKSLTMLDSKGAVVNGFKYQPNGSILNSPQHFRKGTKDYIAFTTDKKELKLISRTGGERTKVNEALVAKSDLYFHNNLIQFINGKDKLVHVNPTSGKVTTTKTAVDQDSKVAFTNRTQLIQSKNSLQINGTNVNLPYGTYLPAKISRVNNKDYVTIIDAGENKVYILDRQGKVLPFLPVYGSKSAEIAGAKSRYLVTLDQNDVLIYKW